MGSGQGRCCVSTLVRVVMDLMSSIIYSLSSHVWLGSWSEHRSRIPMGVDISRRVFTTSSTLNHIWLISSTTNNDDNDDEASDEQEEFIDIGTLDFNTLIDPQLKKLSTVPSLSTTQLGLQRMEGTTDTYCPRSLLPRLYQSNPFARQQNDEETSTIAH